MANIFNCFSRKTPTIVATGAGNRTPHATPAREANAPSGAPVARRIVSTPAAATLAKSSRPKGLGRLTFRSKAPEALVAFEIAAASGHANQPAVRHNVREALTTMEPVHLDRLVAVVFALDDPKTCSSYGPVFGAAAASLGRDKGRFVSRLISELRKLSKRSKEDASRTLAGILSECPDLAPKDLAVVRELADNPRHIEAVALLKRVRELETRLEGRGALPDAIATRRIASEIGLAQLTQFDGSDSPHFDLFPDTACELLKAIESSDGSGDRGRELRALVRDGLSRALHALPIESEPLLVVAATRKPADPDTNADLRIHRVANRRSLGIHAKEDLRKPLAEAIDRLPSEERPEWTQAFYAGYGARTGPGADARATSVHSSRRTVHFHPRKSFIP